MRSGTRRTLNHTPQQTINHNPQASSLTPELKLILMGVRYEYFKFGAGMSPGLRRWFAQIE